MTLQMSWTRRGIGAEPLLLLHAFGSTRDDFAPVRPELEDYFDVVSPDLAGHGDSRCLAAPLPTVSALADALESDLDELGIGRVHVLGNSLGGRLALELAVRGRAMSVVALSPSGVSLPAERLVQGLVMASRRAVLCSVRGVITPAARFTIGRSLLSAGMRSVPWQTSEAEAHALADGIAEAEDFWRMLWWAVLTDHPVDLHKINVPVMLAEGTADVITGGQTSRYLLLVPRARYTPLWGAGHAPQSDAPMAIVALVRRAAARASVQRVT